MQKVGKSPTLEPRPHAIELGFTKKSNEKKFAPALGFFLPTPLGKNCLD